MIYSFDRIKALALKTNYKNRGRSVGYNEFLLYDEAHDTVIFYRPSFADMAEQEEFRTAGYNPDRSYILAHITPEKFAMTELFRSVTFDQARSLFNVLSDSVPGKKFLGAWIVQASDFAIAVTRFPLVYTYGEGFTNIADPRTKKDDPKKRAELNKLIREKRHMLKTRYKLGAKFPITPELLAKNVLDAASLSTARLRHPQATNADRLHASPYLGGYYINYGDVAVNGARALLNLLSAAEAESIESLASLLAFRRVGVSRLSPDSREALNRDFSVATIASEYRTNHSAAIAKYNALSPEEKYRSFEARLNNLKPSMRLVYGADYHDFVGQDEAKQLLGIEV